MRNCVITFLLIGLMLAAVLTMSAQDIPVTSQGNLLFYVDHAAFQGKEGLTYVEFYLMLYADQLTRTIKDKTHITEIGIRVLINDERGGILSENDWTTEAVLNSDTTNLSGLVIYDQWAKQILPGKYMMKVDVHDVKNLQKTGSTDFELFVPEILNQPLSASQIEFVSHAEKSYEQGHFVKNKRKVIPNPSRRYGILNPTIFIYFEIYHIPESINELTLNYFIRQTNGALVRNFPERQVPVSGVNISLIHGFDVSTVSSGIYEFCIAIQDSNGREATTTSRQFEVIQLDYFDSSPELTEQEEEIAARLLKYIATPDEYRFYQQLNLKSKARFLIQFWRDKDPTPGTSENEFLNQIQQRYLFANKNFSWGGIEGWNTDRGRVLIQYGMPDEIEKFHSDAASSPYEIWQYQQERNYIFIFGDVRADGRFTLLHSTRENEIHNVRWKELLRKL